MERDPNKSLPPPDERMIRLVTSAFGNLVEIDEEIAVNKRIGGSREHAVSLYREKGYNAHLILLSRFDAQIPVTVQLSKYPNEEPGPFAENSLELSFTTPPRKNTLPSIRVTVSLIAEAVAKDSMQVLDLIGQPDSMQDDSALEMVRRTYEEIRSVQRFIKTLTEGYSDPLRKELENERTRLVKRVLSARRAPGMKYAPLFVEKKRSDSGSYTRVWIDGEKYINVDNKKSVVSLIEESGGYDHDETVSDSSF